MRFISWVVMVICSAVVFLIAEFLIWLVSLAAGAISTLSTFMQIVIYLFGGTTLLGIVLAPLLYGGMLTVLVSEAVKPSKAGKRYKVFSILIIVFYSVTLLLLILARSIGVAEFSVSSILGFIYVIAFGVSLLISANAIIKSKEEEGLMESKTKQNYNKDDVIDALSKGLITPEDAKQKLNTL